MQQQGAELISQKAPVIVCGMPRSGTTFVGQLLRCHPGIAVADEFPLPVLLSVPQLLSEVGGLLSAPFEGWRQAELSSVPLRKMRLLIQLWAAVTGDREQARRLLVPDIRPGVKTPSAELYYQFYEDVFALAPPLWIYCVRHPFKVLRSFASMPWASGKVVEQVSDLYRRSLEAYCELEHLASERVLPVGIDHAGDIGLPRLQWASSILALANEVPTLEVNRFIGEWPRMDHWNAADGQRRAAASIDAESLVWFAKQRHIRHFCQKFGFDLGSC